MWGNIPSRQSLLDISGLMILFGGLETLAAWDVSSLSQNAYNQMAKGPQTYQSTLAHFRVGHGDGYKRIERSVQLQRPGELVIP